MFRPDSQILRKFSSNPTRSIIISRTVDINKIIMIIYVFVFCSVCLFVFAFQLLRFQVQDRPMQNTEGEGECTPFSDGYG